MPIDPFLTPVISNQIPGQFPDWYQENGPVFVEFVRQYYKWMESDGQSLYYGRRFLDLNDIDTTLDDFIIHFKNKFLPNIQLQSSTNYRQLVKHSLDLYRSRGTERSVNLLLRVIFGARASVYRPSIDIFRLSDGKWVQPVYIEVVGEIVPSRFVEKQIIGVRSSATAFVESFVRRLNNGRVVNVFYLSNIVGDFTSGEPINLRHNPYDVSTCPIVKGSMSTVQVIDGGQGSAIGDILEAVVDGRNVGLVRVSATEDLTGAANIALVDGGYGYTANASVITSQQVIVVRCGAWPQSPHFFTYNETISQGNTTATIMGQSSNVVITIAGTSQFVTNEAVAQYDVNGIVVANGSIMTTVQGTGTTDITISHTVGSFTNAYPIVGQTSGATANIQYTSVRVGLINISGSFSNTSNVSFITSSNTTGTITFVGSGGGASACVVSNNLILTEKISLFSDLLSTYANTPLNGIYNFPNMVNSNTTTPLNIALSSTSYTVGKIEQLTSVTEGSNYSLPPLFRVIDSTIAKLYRRDLIIAISGLTTAFSVGEVVAQTGGARGVVKKGSNTSVLFLQRLSINSEFIATNSTNNYAYFTSTGAYASILTVDADLSHNINDIVPVNSGENAMITATASLRQDVVTAVDVVDSGFGHTEAETLMFYSNNNVVLGNISTDTQGKSKGYYENKGGFLSSDKKLYDGLYYQDYSYEVQTSVPFDMYKKMLKDIVHVAGTKAFGALYHGGFGMRELDVRPLSIQIGP